MTNKSKLFALVAVFTCFKSITFALPVPVIDSLCSGALTKTSSKVYDGFYTVKVFTTGHNMLVSSGTISFARTATDRAKLPSPPDSSQCSRKSTSPRWTLFGDMIERADLWSCLETMSTGSMRTRAAVKAKRSINGRDLGKYAEIRKVDSVGNDYFLGNISCKF